MSARRPLRAAGDGSTFAGATVDCGTGAALEAESVSGSNAMGSIA